MTNATNPLAAFHSVGSGPAHFRRDMHAQARRVWRVLRAPAALSGVESRFPGALFGDALTAFLSDRLRRLLEQDRTADAIVAGSHRAPSEAEHAHGRNGPVVWPHATVAPRAHDASPNWPPGAPPGSSAAAVTNTPTSPSRLGDPAVETLLARALREYWTLSAPETARRERLDAAPDRSHAAPAAEPAPPSAGPAGELSPDLIAGRMHAFVVGAPFAGASPPSAPGGALDAARSAAGSARPAFSARHTSFNSDLAESLADVLREQAILHGVDIT